jgi:hypothetical protein
MVSPTAARWGYQSPGRTTCLGQKRRVERSAFPWGVPKSDICHCVSDWECPGRPDRDWGVRGTKVRCYLPAMCGWGYRRTETAGSIKIRIVLPLVLGSKGEPNLETNAAGLSAEPENDRYTPHFNARAFCARHLKRASGRRGVPKSDTFRRVRLGAGYLSPNLQPPSDLNHD